LAEFAAKGTASHYITGILRCVLSVSLEELGNAALGVRRVVHQFEQRQIAQLETAVNVALRNNTAVLHHDIRWESGLKTRNLHELRAQVAS
jgi:hypothetical protein